MMGSDFLDSQVKGLVEEQSRGICQISDVNWKKGLKKELIESEIVNGGRIPMQDLEGLSIGGEGSFLPWIMGQVDAPNLSLKNLLQCGSSFGFDGYNGLETSIPLLGVENLTNFIGNFGGNGGGGGLGFTSYEGNCNTEVGEQFMICDEKPQVVNPHFGFGQQLARTGQNPNYYVGSVGYNHGELENPFLPPMKNRNYGGVVEVSRSALLSEGPEDRFQMQQQQLLMSMTPQNLQKSMDLDKDSQVSVLRDHLIKVSEMFQTGNFSLTQVILARLNHQASLPGDPLVVATFLYVKEELEKLMSMNGMPSVTPPPKSLSLDDVLHKIRAYKLFSEVSPIMEFVNFTCTQTFLEALEDADTIHVLDFDIGCGSMWASFIRGLPLRKKGIPFLKITVLASTSSHHPFELALIFDKILEFATEYGVSVDIRVLNLDLFDSTSCTFPEFQLMENEVVAIKFPIWACSHCPFLLPSLLSFMKQCSPKIVMSFDRGGDRYDLPFPSHIVHCLNSCYSILESLNSSSVLAEIIRKVENSLLRPWIERTIQGRIHTPTKMHSNETHSWKSLFPSAGFVPTTISNFTEYQAHGLVSKLTVEGFNVEKQRASIVLRWLSHELVAGLAWSC